MPSLPFNPFRATLYTPEELLGDYVPGNFDTYDNTVDGATYRQYKEEGKDDNTDVRITLARRLLVGVYVMLKRGEEFSLERCLAA